MIAKIGLQQFRVSNKFWTIRWCVKHVLCVILISVVYSHPDVAAVYVGSTKTFSCSANNSERVLWHFTPASLTSVLKIINVGKNLTLKFAQRYHMNDVNQSANLVISNVQHCDAGFFRCNTLTNNGRLRTCDFLLITVGKHSIVTC